MPSNMTEETPPRRPATFTLRLTREDRLRLEHGAAGIPLGEYIRWRVFDPDRPPPRHRGKAPVKDHVALSSLLAQIGRMASNLNQIAKAANSGLLALSPDGEAQLLAALDDITVMRDLLVAALGLSEHAP